MIKKNFAYSIAFALTVFSCQSGVNNNKASAIAPDNTIKINKIVLDYSDTSKPEYQHLIAKLDDFYANQVRAGFNGSVLIGYKGKVLYKRYFGFKNYTTKEIIGPQTTFQLASTSKPFTATAILWLAERGMVNVEAPVSDYVPGFPYEGITVKNLLTHRSGLPDYLHFYQNYWKNPKAFMTNQDLVDMLVRYKPAIQAKPNTRFAYCNTNYALLGYIIEKVSKTSYPEFMKTFVFGPLGLDNTFVFDPRQPCPPNASVCYSGAWRLEPNTPLDGVYGDKGIYSTVEDLFKWDQSFYQHPLISDSSLKAAYTPYSNEKPGVKNYGLGWRMLCYPDGNKIIYHNGFWHGNNTVFYRFIQDNVTIIVLGNRRNSNIYQQAKQICSILNAGTMQEMSGEMGGE
jgi:CubicO group peptidase (beta-lactamase class C family)